jgi:DNA-directed RNA polymerase specialized sigma24 family protein
LRGQEEWRRLQRAIYALPEAQREAVRRHLRGEAVGDIAATLKRSPAAISCLLQRAGKRLQQQLGGNAPLGPWFQTLRKVLAESDAIR